MLHKIICDCLDRSKEGFFIEGISVIEFSLDMSQTFILNADNVMTESSFV